MKINPLKGQRHVTVRLKKARSRSNSSQRWLQRQLNDPYVQQAHQQGLRSRAAFKLMQLDDKFHFLKPGRCIIDLGTAPGGWAQVAVNRTESDKKGGYIIGIDLLEVEPLKGANFLQGDFLEPDIRSQVKMLARDPAHVVLSDMAASTIGHAQTDHLRTEVLSEVAFDFAKEMLRPGGTFVTKVFQGGTHPALLMNLKQHFEQIKHVKPPASRKESPEMYVLCFGFKP